MPDVVSLEDRALGYLLGLGDLAAREFCMGYANACICSGCVERQERVAELLAMPEQPWVPKPARDAA